MHPNPTMVSQWSSKTTQECNNTDKEEFLFPTQHAPKMAWLVINCQQILSTEWKKQLLNCFLYKTRQWVHLGDYCED